MPRFLPKPHRASLALSPPRCRVTEPMVAKDGEERTLPVASEVAKRLDCARLAAAFGWHTEPTPWRPSPCPVPRPVPRPVPCPVAWQSGGKLANRNNNLNVPFRQAVQTLRAPVRLKTSSGFVPEWCRGSGSRRRGLFVRFARAVLGQNLQPCHQQHVYDLVIAIRLVNDQLAPGRSQSDKVFVLHDDASAVRKVDQEGAKRLHMEEFANFIDLHLGNCIGGSRLCKKRRAEPAWHGASRSCWLGRNPQATSPSPRRTGRGVG